MSQGKDVLFDGVLVDSLFSRVALYPTGSILSLDVYKRQLQPMPTAWVPAGLVHSQKTK